MTIVFEGIYMYMCVFVCESAVEVHVDLSLQFCYHVFQNVLYIRCIYNILLQLYATRMIVLYMYRTQAPLVSESLCAAIVLVAT